jgi:hypothetical protein
MYPISLSFIFLFLFCLSCFQADSVREALRDKWCRSGAPVYRIDITCSSTTNEKEAPVLLERWEIAHRIERDMIVDDINAQLMRSYKRITVMLRTLYSFCRIVPTYRVCICHVCVCETSPDFYLFFTHGFSFFLSHL